MNTIYPIFDDIRKHRVRGRCIYPLNDLLKPKGRFFYVVNQRILVI